MSVDGKSFSKVFRRGSNKRNQIATVMRQFVLACNIVILCLVGTGSAEKKAGQRSGAVTNRPVVVNCGTAGFPPAVRHVVYSPNGLDNYYQHLQRRTAALGLMSPHFDRRLPAGRHVVPSWIDYQHERRVFDNPRLVTSSSPYRVPFTAQDLRANPVAQPQVGAAVVRRRWFTPRSLERERNLENNRRRTLQGGWGTASGWPVASPVAVSPPIAGTAPAGGPITCPQQFRAQQRVAMQCGEAAARSWEMHPVFPSLLPAHSAPNFPITLGSPREQRLPDRCGASGWTSTVICEPTPPAPDDENLKNIALEISYDVICEATNKFGSESLLGAGTFGKIYSGWMHGSLLAIKELDVPDQAGFLEEVQVLSKFRHTNLVTLVGFARGTDKTGHLRYLVYEKLEMDLFSWLRPVTWKTDPFSSTWTQKPKWEQKLSILCDVAQGLSFLHHSGLQDQNGEVTVFHRDIKTQNIMIDKNGAAKMIDFGSALLASSKAAKVKSAAGTEGYRDPLYVKNGFVTEKNEVYSFGMVILEILTGTPPLLQSQDGRVRTRYYQDAQGQNIASVDSIIARSSAGWMEGEKENLLRDIVKVAFRCIRSDPEKRPDFVTIVKRFRAWLDDHRR